MLRVSVVVLLGVAVLPVGAAARIAPVGPQPTAAVLLQVEERPFGRELSDLRQTIKDARDRGQLSRQQARRLRGEARLIASLASRFAQDGLSADEYRELEFRTIVARQQTDAMRGVNVGSPPPR